MKNIKYFIVAFLFYGCDMNNQKLVLVNETNKTVYYRLLTDTILYEGLYIYKLNSSDSVSPNFVMGKGEGVWERKINTASKDSSLHIFIFPIGSLLDNKLTKSIINGKTYKRYDLKVNDLEKARWKVYYKE